MSLTQYYTATTLDGFIADPNHSLDWLFTRGQTRPGANYPAFIAGVGALAMGSSTYEWILDHEFAGKDPAEWKWPYELPSWVFTHRELQVVPDADDRVRERRRRAGARGDARGGRRAGTSGSSVAAIWSAVRRRRAARRGHRGHRAGHAGRGRAAAAAPRRAAPRGASAETATSSPRATRSCAPRPRPRTLAIARGLPGGGRRGDAHVQIPQQPVLSGRSTRARSALAAAPGAAHDRRLADVRHLLDAR